MWQAFAIGSCHYSREDGRTVREARAHAARRRGKRPGRHGPCSFADRSIAAAHERLRRSGSDELFIDTVLRKSTYRSDAVSLAPPRQNRRVRAPTASASSCAEPRKIGADLTTRAMHPRTTADRVARARLDKSKDYGDVVAQEAVDGEAPRSPSVALLPTAWCRIGVQAAAEPPPDTAYD